MMNNVKYLSFALILAFSACKSGSASSQEPSEKQDTVKIFNLPQIPVVLNTVEQRTDYMVKSLLGSFRLLGHHLHQSGRSCRTGLGRLL